MTNQDFGVAVFPFLTTSRPTIIGGYTFRSTTDLTDLPTEQAQAVTDIAQMLFVHGDVRVESAAYAIVPSLDIHQPSDAVAQLWRVRTTLAYIYASPHEALGDLFLSPEDVSLALLIPDQVSVFVVRPEHRTAEIVTEGRPDPDPHHNVPGFRGLYNFTQYFWVERRSRLYGPKAHMSLGNQDLSRDLQQHFDEVLASRMLLQLLEKSVTPTAVHIYSALHWYNAGTEASIDADRALLNLAVAFETLFRLPESAKTERLVDAIALLLGRVDRLDDWAHQFYAARSAIAHEGRAQSPYFYIPAARRTKDPEGLFGSLILYGRQIFRLCLGTLLVGSDLAERADLQEKFVTNNERYQKICELLQAKVAVPNEKLIEIEPTVLALRRYQFVAFGALSSVTIISAVRYCAETLLDCGLELPEQLSDALLKMKTSLRTDEESAQFEAVKELAYAFNDPDRINSSRELLIVRELVDLSWMNLFQGRSWRIGREPQQ